MIIDGHVHLGKSIFGYELNAEDLLKNMSALGIDKCVICPVQPYDYHLEPENNFIATVAEKYPSSLIGFCRVDPRQKAKAVLEVERAISTLGAKGVFLHPWEEGYRVNADFVVSVVRKAAQLQVPVMVSTGYPWCSHALQVADLASQVPEATVIMTNGGQINISGMAIMDAFEALQRQSNLLIDTAGVYRQDFLENVMNRFGAERVLFSSNAPQMNQQFEFDRALSATKSNTSYRNAILGGNVARLIK